MATPIGYTELATALSSGGIVLLDAQAPGWFERAHLPTAFRLDWVTSPARSAPRFRTGPRRRSVCRAMSR